MHSWIPRAPKRHSPALESGSPARQLETAPAEVVFLAGAKHPRFDGAAVQDG